MFCTPRLVFDGTEGVGSRLHVLHTWTHFQRNRGRRLPFSCFVFPDSFSAVPRVSGHVFIFCALGLIFGCNEGFWSRIQVLRSRSRFHVLCSRTHFLRYRGRRVPFSCFVRPYSFSTVLRASAHIFMFCAPGVVFGGTEGVGSRFNVLRSRTPFRRYRGRRVRFSCIALPDSFSMEPRASGRVFMFWAPGLIFSRAEGVRSRFHVLRTRTCF
jgi:hypothetical protein